MTDIKAIAATYAARIFDRMEMCRGSAILKSDIEREVEMALNEMIGAPKATPASIAEKALKALADAHTPEFSGIDFCVPYSGFRFRVEGDTLIHEPIPQEEMYDTEHDEHLGPLLKQVDTRCLITPKQAEERGIPIGAAGYVWVENIEPGTIFGTDD